MRQPDGSDNYLVFMRSEAISNGKYPCTPIDGSSASTTCQPNVRQDYTMYENGTLNKQDYKISVRVRVKVRVKFRVSVRVRTTQCTKMGP